MGTLVLSNKNHVEAMNYIIIPLLSTGWEKGGLIAIESIINMLLYFQGGQGKKVMTYQS